MRWAAAVAAVAALGLGAAILWTSRDGDGLPAESRERLERIADHAASYNGDDDPDSVRIVETNRRAVERAAGSSRSAPDERVYLVEVEGDFTVYDAVAPGSTAAPRSDTITLVVSARTMRVTDFYGGRLHRLHEPG